jgi:dGTPase
MQEATTDNPRMSWDKLLSTNRLGQKNDAGTEENDRSEFERDIDRIIFSGPFRRLSRKTQVHPMAANDHVHTRLTHSLEVSQVGRTLGKTIGNKIAERGELPHAFTPNDVGAVVQAACLAHDLGNPPFGHGGEKGMSNWFELNGPAMFGAMSKEHKHDIISIEGNAQGFRIITQLENRLFKGGLCLTYATLGAFLKYPWTSRVPDKKFGAYISEEKILEEIANGLGLLRSKRLKHTHDEHRHEWSRHPLAFLVEAADDICYGFIDLEDAVELKILHFDEVAETFESFFEPKEKKKLWKSFNPNKQAFRINLARLRGRLFEKAISGAIEGFMNGYDIIMEGKHNGDVFDLLENNDPRKKLVSTAKKMCAQKVFQDSRKIEIEIGCYSTFDTLLNAFCKAALESAQCIKSGDEMRLGWKSKLVLQLLGVHAPTKDNRDTPDGAEWTQYQCLRRVIDFVSGMTDNYATYIAGQLQGMGFSGIQRP